MPVYMADRKLPGITAEEVAVARKAAIETSLRFTAEGRPVFYLRSTFLPEESRLMCLFAAADATLVRDVNEAAQLPFTRIVEVLDLAP